MSEHQLTQRFLDVLQQDIIPATREGVEDGNKIFGAAILRKSDLSLVIAETNNETENPLWHGEVHTLKRFYENFPDTKTSDLIFLSTHEPCSMCLSAITWAGFDNIYYYFSHEDSRDAFAIPHDLVILKEVFDCDPGAYRRKNAFWNCISIKEMANSAEINMQSGLKEQMKQIDSIYDALSTAYQSGKDNNAIPLN